MKMKQLLLVLGVFMLLFSSCEDPSGNYDYTPPTVTGINRPDPIGKAADDVYPFVGIDDPSPYGGDFPSSPESLNFWALNMEGSSPSDYTLQAELLYEGEKCEIWGETGSNVLPDTAEAMAKVYDRTIYPRMMAAFNSGENFVKDGEVVATNPMEYASWMVDGDGKLTILLLNIQNN